MYHWNLATIAVFYGLPVVQLMVTYQEMSNSTGNQECTQLKAKFGGTLGWTYTFQLTRSHDLLNS